MKLRRRHQIDAEGGFTLVELLVSVTILIIIVSVLGEATILAFKVTGSAADSLVQTADGHTLTTDLQNDIGSAAQGPDAGGALQIPALQAGLTATVDDPACDRGGVPWLQTHRNVDASGAAASVNVSYVVTTTASGTVDLVRVPCGTPDMARVVAPSLSCEPTVVDQALCPSSGLLSMSPSTITVGNGVFPVSGPYVISIGGHLMTVTATATATGGTSLTLKEPAAVGYAPGASVVLVYQPNSLVCDPPGCQGTTGTATVALTYRDGSSYSLTVSRHS